MTDSEIDIQNINKTYQTGTKALNNVTLSVLPGSFITIIGPSGCGKTTLLRTINKMTEFDSGNIEIFGKNLQSWNEIELRRSIGYVIQSGALFPHMTIKQNIEFVLTISGVEKSIRDKRVKYLSDMMGFEERQLISFPSELSGGQQQRVGVARALACEPKIVLMDEPFGALDNITRRKLQSELKVMHKNMGITFIMVTHDLHEAFTIGTHLVIMNEGSVVQYDTAENIRKNPLNDWVYDFISVQNIL